MHDLMRAFARLPEPISAPTGLTAPVVGGQLAISDESTELRFVQPEEIDQLPMHHTQRLRISHFLEHRERPYLG